MSAPDPASLMPTPVLDRGDGTGASADELIARRFAALGAPTRLAIIRLLARYAPRAMPAGEIARLLAVHPATLSAHLGLLSEAGLVTAHRQGRIIAYRLHDGALEGLVATLSLGRTLPRGGATLAAGEPVRVVFVCTRNSARSIMAEALLNRYGNGRFHAVSAGSKPASALDPAVVRLLTQLRFDITGLAPKSWIDVSGPAATPVDLVISVCDDAASEPCPTFIGPAHSVHWGIPDPVAAPEAEREAAVRLAYRQLSARITELATLDWAAMTPQARAAALHQMARMDGATALARVWAA